MFIFWGWKHGSRDGKGGLFFVSLFVFNFLKSDGWSTSSVQNGSAQQLVVDHLEQKFMAASPNEFSYQLQTNQHSHQPHLCFVYWTQFANVSIYHRKHGQPVQPKRIDRPLLVGCDTGHKPLLLCYLDGPRPNLNLKVHKRTTTNVSNMCQFRGRGHEKVWQLLTLISFHTKCSFFFSSLW